MPSNQTTNYHLSQWVKSDQVRMEDFNADNAKIDAALKAETDARTAAVEALSQTSANHTASIAKLGNCQIYSTSYTGNGGTQHSMTFPHRPVFIYVADKTTSSAFAAPRGVTRGVTWSGDGNWVIQLSWSGNTVTWKKDSSSTTFAFETSGSTYIVLALLDAGQ